MVVGLKLEKFDADEPDVEEPFRSLVGQLMWLASQTRPDILNAVRAVARYSHAPKRLHWQAAMHVLMYVRFTSSFGITFQRGMVGGDQMELFVDSDFASKATDRRSVSRVVVMFAGACVMYLCRAQKSVALSSMNAEYVAMDLIALFDQFQTRYRLQYKKYTILQNCKRNGLTFSFTIRTKNSTSSLLYWLF